MGNFITNVGVIGLGEQGWDNLLPSIAVLKNANIQAVCDLDSEKCMTAARNYGAKQYGNYMEMLDTEKLDAVVVASHPSVHKAVLETTIARGVPTFVEKPPTLYTNELNELIQLNSAYQTITAVGLNFSFTEPIKFLKTMMKKSEFGHLEYVRVSHYGNKPTDVMWGLNSLPRSFLLSQAIHPLGLIFDLGQPTSDTPLIRAYKNSEGMLFNVNMQLTDRNNRKFTAELLTCSTSPFFEWQLQIISNKGVMVNINSLWEIEVYSQHRSNPMIDNQKWWRDIWKPSPLSGGFKRNGYEHQFASFFESIKSKTANGTSLERMIPIYNLMDAMEKNCERQEVSS
jgi:predicted dehydrogenase